MAIASYQRARINSQNGAFINDLRIIDCAINTYIFDHRFWIRRTGWCMGP